MLGTVIQLADRFGAIDGVRHALLQQTDKAGIKLADVLGELAKTVAVLDDEMVRYLSLHFSSDESIRHGRTVLLGMEVGQSAIRIDEGRGHCHRIRNIYDTYLDKWFDRVFGATSTDRQHLRDVFNGLGSADDYMIQAMQEVSGWLQTEAAGTLDAVDGGDLLEANRRVRRARLDVRPDRVRLAATMASLRRMQADFIESTGLV